MPVLEAGGLAVASPAHLDRRPVVDLHLRLLVDDCLPPFSPSAWHEPYSLCTFSPEWYSSEKNWFIRQCRYLLRSSALISVQCRMNVEQQPLALFIRSWRLARGLGRRTLHARGLGRRTVNARGPC